MFNKCSSVRVFAAIRGKGAMSTTWNTKWGARRVRKEPPTLEEALIAAEAMTFDAESRAEIAAQLMGLPVEDVRTALARQQAQTRGRATLVNGRSRAVVVEYKRPRTIARPMAGPMGRR
jgi:hypothetical protein